MDQRGPASRFLFPKWANYVVPAGIIAAVMSVPYIVLLVGFSLNPTTLAVGYQPEQPIPYSHELHVNQLGMDCRYCHTTVEDASFAAIPPTDTCMSCHHSIHTQSPRLEALYASFRTGMPIEWKKVHKLPDFAYFNHSAHVNKGVSCVSCHGRIDRMGFEGVFQHEPLSMGWCLECHRDPAPNLRPVEEVTNLMWGLNLTEREVNQLNEIGIEGLEVGGALSEEQRRRIGHEQILKHEIKSPLEMQDCSACHR